MKKVVVCSILVLLISFTSCSNNKPFDLSNSIFHYTSSAYEIIDNISSDIYNAWRLAIYDSDLILSDGLNYLAPKLNVDKSVLCHSFVHEFFNLTDSYSTSSSEIQSSVRKKYIFEHGDSLTELFSLNESCLFNYCVDSIVCAYDFNGKLNEASFYLEQAGNLLRELSERFSDYEHYPALKDLLSTTSSFYDFCSSPSGSFNQLQDTLNKFRLDYNDRIYDLKLFFEDVDFSPIPLDTSKTKDTEQFSYETQCIHKFGQWIYDVSSSCTEEGLMHRICDYCSFEEQQILPSTHSIQVATIYQKPVEPSCSSTGLSEGRYCANCGYVFQKQTIIPAIEHNYSTITNRCTMCDQYDPNICFDVGESWVVADQWRITVDSVKEITPCKICFDEYENYPMYVMITYSYENIGYSYYKGLWYNISAISVDDETGHYAYDYFCFHNEYKYPERTKIGKTCSGVKTCVALKNQSDNICISLSTTTSDGRFLHAFCFADVERLP